jgi:hypothetical protein
MQPLEDELGRALRRLDAPPGFTNRVMARVEQASASKPRPAWLRPLQAFWSWAEAWTGQSAVLGLAATAAVLVLAVSFAAWRQHRLREEQRQGELARAQVMQALRVTSVKLQRVRSRVREATQDGDRAPHRDNGSRTHRSDKRGYLARARQRGSVGA